MILIEEKMLGEWSCLLMVYANLNQNAKRFAKRRIKRIIRKLKEAKK